MERYEKLKKLSDKKFKRAIGIPRLLFEIYILVITEALEIKHKKGGRKPKLSAEDILLLMLYYYRDYTTFFKLGLEFGIDESNSYRWVKWCEETLVEYSMELFDGLNMNLDNEYIVDVMECPVERPKNQELQREFYSGKKKKHTIKIQIVIEENTKKIVLVSFDKGNVHDFKLFKQSTSNFNEKLKFLSDSGYKGIQNLFLNSLIPKKEIKEKSTHRRRQGIKSFDFHYKDISRTCKLSTKIFQNFVRTL